MTGERRGEGGAMLAGAAVIAALALFVAWQYGLDRAAGTGGYELIARFDRVDGVVVGSEVRAAGIAVGRVAAMELDPDMRAVLTLRIDPGITFDIDASAAVATDGLFGGKHVEIDIGGGEEPLAPGDEVAYTESAVLLDDLLDLVIAEGRRQATRAPAAE